MPNINAASMGTYGSTWQAVGYSGVGPVASLLGTLQGRSAIVVGSAEGTFNELEDALGKVPDAVIFGVNDTGMFLPRMDHWVSLHSDNLGAWKTVRWLHPREREDVRLHSIEMRPYVDHVWQSLTPLFALSGYFAMQIAYLMGADPIVLCGCPGSSVPRFYESKPRPNFGYGDGVSGTDDGVRKQVIDEMERLPAFKARVRSMSGWSNQFFGGL